MKVLLTGKHGCDKSVVLLKFLKQYTGEVDGVYSRMLFDEKNNRVGFEAIRVKGGSRVIAHSRMFTPSSCIVADKYFVDVDAINSFVVPALEEAVKNTEALIVIDEIGPIEAYSARFLTLIEKLLRSERHMLATIVQDPEPWSIDFKQNPEARVIRVDPPYRDMLSKYLLDVFEPSKKR
jgi:nucleoside-triphosphatase THEP1